MAGSWLRMADAVTKYSILAIPSSAREIATLAGSIDVFDTARDLPTTAVIYLKLCY